MFTAAYKHIDVTIAKDGQEAFDIVRASMEHDERYDLVFMDIQMPNLDGIQSTKRIREMGFSAPIVALTAFAEESNVKECMDSGMDYFLSKPIRRPALKQVLKKYCPTIQEEDSEADGNDPKPGSRRHSRKPSKIKGVAAKKDKPAVAKESEQIVQSPGEMSIKETDGSHTAQGRVRDVIEQAKEAQEVEGISPMSKAVQ